jgi:type I restriction enzyme M protein
MSNEQQKEQLHKTIWSIADELRGAIGGWEFKAYVLGTLFYRFISENLTEYINNIQKESGYKNFDYATISDEIAIGIKDMMVAEKGFFILPSQLFCNVCKTCTEDVNLNMTLSKIFDAIESSAKGTVSEEKFKGLFSDFNVNDSQLGGDVKTRNKLIAKVLLKVHGMKLGEEFMENKIDAFGDAYEFLMTMYASNAGKSGGEFFTPQEVSELLARLAAADGHEIRSVYDPACGSGSLLLKFSKTIGRENSSLKYYGQEINHTTYNLCRINMFLHNINYDNFDIQWGDTLLDPKHPDLLFDAIVSNPPYSIPWEGSKNPLLINDDRYSGPGVLAPDSSADLAFTLHMLKSLSESGTAAIVEFPGVLYRSGKEEAIRYWLVENNYVDTVIQLPSNLFFGVGIATCVIVLRKGMRPDNRVLFIDASKEFVKNGNKNKLTPANQDHIFNVFQKRTEEQYFSRLVPISEILKTDDKQKKFCNLSVSSYVEQEDTREAIDIKKVNSTLIDLVTEGNVLNDKIVDIINELGEE